MLTMKSKKVVTLLFVAILASFTVFLGACKDNSDISEVTFGLRSEAVGDLVETGSSEVGQIVSSTPGDDVEMEMDIVTQVDSDVVGLTDRNRQSRTAGLSDQVIDPTTLIEPDGSEKEGLTFMREEEKLARDVYLALYEQWNMPVFQNIAASEQVHMDSILMLLDQYSLNDPAAGKGPGEFTDPYFQSLYEQLVEKGRVSLVDALTVAATIEELDIVDLEDRLGQTDDPYISNVYGNLLAGSENHLRAFVSTLERQTGESYQPVHLDEEDFEAIMGAGSNGGRGGGNGNGGNSKGSGGGNGRRYGQAGNA